ncbi:hypothetical protein BGZ52_007510 [Haplosporangium bisporale]|nr:hypothetical protein BGZ52_007510 [Haplosporangium bisporale]
MDSNTPPPTRLHTHTLYSRVRATMSSSPSSTPSSSLSAHVRSSSEDRRSSTPEPFTDPNPHSDSTRQKVAQIVALPLAAAGGVIYEVTQKVKELVTGESTKIDTPKHSKTTLPKE